MWSKWNWIPIMEYGLVIFSQSFCFLHSVASQALFPRVSSFTVPVWPCNSMSRVRSEQNQASCSGKLMSLQGLFQNHYMISTFTWSETTTSCFWHCLTVLGVAEPSANEESTVSLIVWWFKNSVICEAAPHRTWSNSPHSCKGPPLPLDFALLLSFF